MTRVFCRRASKSTRAAQACRCVAWLEGACALKEVRAKRKEKLRARVEFAGRKCVCLARQQPTVARQEGGQNQGPKFSRAKFPPHKRRSIFWGVFGASFENQNSAPCSSACDPRPGPRASTHALPARHKRDAFQQRLPEHGLLAPAAKVRDGHAEQALELRCSLSQSRFELTAQALQGQPQNLLFLLAWFLRPAQALLATQTGFPRCVVLRVL